MSENVFKKVGPRGYFDVPTVLSSRTFHRFFTPSRVEMSSSGGDNDTLGGGAVAVSGDEGETRHSRDEHPRSESP